MHFGKVSQVIAIVASSWRRDKNMYDLSSELQSTQSTQSIDLSPIIHFHNKLQQKFEYLQGAWSNITDSSSSKISYISSSSWNTNKFHTIDHEDDSQKSLEAFQTWWKNSTHGRSGLVIQLVPAVASQLALIKKIAPYFIGLTNQYIEPVSLLALYSLSHNRLRHSVRAGALVYVCLSAGAMLFDLYRGGSNFLPLKPSDDAYTLITE